VYLADISGTKRRHTWKLKLRKIKNIRDLYRGISDFKKGYQPRNNNSNYRGITFLPTTYKILSNILL